MKKVVLAIVVIIAIISLGFLVFGSSTTKEMEPEMMWKQKEKGSTPAELAIVKEKPEPGKYRFVKDYIISVCVKTALGWEGMPYCVNNEYKDKILFKKGDVVNSYRAFYNDQGTGWGIGLDDGLVYGGTNIGIEMFYVEKVPDSTPEKYNKF